MLKLQEVLDFRLKMGNNPLNVAELLADRLILAEALDKAVKALSYCYCPSTHPEANSPGAVAMNALGEIGQTIDITQRI